ncbi:MAG: TlpA family protein disulfide reductase [Betaproteobacteria bacterium]|nr:TlpA family protein disulfide reductase [Betaproteobacteria bacterium]
MPFPLLYRVATQFAVLAVALAVLPAAAFDLKDTVGQPQKLSEMKGKWVVVNFWATWCAPCVKEIPDIAMFAKESGDKVRVLGIALDWDDEKQLKAFAKKVGHTYPLVLGNDASEKTFGKVKGLPTTIVYDPNGKIAYQKTGTVTRELLARVVKGEKVQ